jgi:hypothetical protein
MRATPRAGTVDEAVPAARRAFAARRRTEFSKSNSLSLRERAGIMSGTMWPVDLVPPPLGLTQQERRIGN